MEIVSTESAPAAIGPYAQAVKTGKLVFCSGQLPVDPVSGAVADDSITGQTRQVLQNLAAVLSVSGASLSRVVKTTVFLADMNDFADMNAEYAQHFGDHTPARATVEVARLPKDVRVEIECVAECGG